MAVTNDHIPDFEDFERYYSGEMPSAEQRVLEGRMLVEPLVADAYEGFLAWREQHSRIADVRSDLRERLRARGTLARRNALPLWAYASAASVLLAIFSYWFVFLDDQSVEVQKLPVAAKREQVKSLPAGVATDAPAEAASVSASQSQKIPGSKALPTPKTASAPSGLADAEIPEEVEDIALEDSFPVKTEEVQATPQPAQTLTTSGAAQAVAKSMADRAKMQREQPDTQYLVASKPVSATTKAYTVTVPVDTLAAAPAMGWTSYRAYLGENTDSSRTTGAVVVTFFVSSTGALSGFVTNGPEELYKEAIRIISSGPAWAPARSKGIPVTSRVEIQLQFRQAQ